MNKIAITLFLVVIFSSCHTDVDTFSEFIDMNNETLNSFTTQVYMNKVREDFVKQLILTSYKELGKSPPDSIDVYSNSFLDLTIERKNGFYSSPSFYIDGNYLNVFYMSISNEGCELTKQAYRTYSDGDKKFDPESMDYYMAVGIQNFFEGVSISDYWGQCMHIIESPFWNSDEFTDEK